jgi:hypothetical protein
LQALTKKGGLDYVPRERTPQGRVFEHAADSNLLVKHLLSIKVPPTEKTTLKEPVFYISSKDDNKKAALILNQDYINLTMMSNGKAELYFHAYFWTTYISGVSKESPQLMNCLEVKRMLSLANKPKQVIEQISKSTFNEEVYNKFVVEFGNRKNTNRTKCIEYL